MGSQGETSRAALAGAESSGVPLLTPAELASAAAAAKIAITAASEEPGEGNKVKTEDEKTEVEVKMELGGDLPFTKTESPEEEVQEGKEICASPKELKKETQHKIETEEHCEEGERTAKRSTDKDLTDEDESQTHVETAGQQKEANIALDSSPKAQPDSKEERENTDFPKSPRSADIVKSLQEEDEERMDEDDKSEKSSQAEGMGMLDTVFSSHNIKENYLRY